MSGLENLNKRLNYRGGNAEGRLLKDKSWSLNKALLYSYQSATIALQDKENPELFTREFRALINPNKNKPDYDNKILSIQYKDIQLNKDRKGKTSEGKEDTLIKPGDVFYWKETNTYWIVYLEDIEERAYFRAEIYRCEKEIEINNRKYKVYYRGPVETTIQWNQKKGDSWNDLNYSAIIYITKNQDTLDFFHRFATIKIDNKNWKVTAINTDTGDGIIKVNLKEEYSNSIEDAALKEKEELEKNDSQQPPQDFYIKGKTELYPYDTATYTIVGSNNGQWVINTKKAKILSYDDNTVTIEITTGKSGNFDLIYRYDEDTQIVLPIQILSL